MQFFSGVPATKRNELMKLPGQKALARTTSFSGHREGKGRHGVGSGGCSWLHE